MTTHYSVAQMEALNPMAEARAKKFIKWFRRRSKTNPIIPVLVYTGMSGTSMATALAMYIRILAPNLKFHMVYIRKDNEDSHGAKVEHTLSKYHDRDVQHVGVFVDDLISSGETLQRCRDKVESFFKEYPKFHIRHTVLFGKYSKRVLDSVMAFRSRDSSVLLRDIVAFRRARMC